MGRYRAFLKERGSYLDMTGKKAFFTSQALRQIIEYLRRFQVSNEKTATDEEVYLGFDFMFSHWDRLNDFHRNRVRLQDIYKCIEEILPMIRNGRDQKSAQQNELQSFKQSLTKR